MRRLTQNHMGTAVLAALTAVSLSSAAAAQETAAMAHPFDFAAIDADKDGSVTLAEVETYRAAQITVMDSDKNGTISAAELAAHQLARMKADMQARADKRAKHMIVDLDSDGDGALSVAEMTAQNTRAARMFDRFDADADGAISEAEADTALAKMTQRGGRHGNGGHRGHGGGDDARGGGKGGFGGFW